MQDLFYVLLHVLLHFDRSFRRQSVVSVRRLQVTLKPRPCPRRWWPLVDRTSTHTVRPSDISSTADDRRGSAGPCRTAVAAADLHSLGGPGGRGWARHRGMAAACRWRWPGAVDRRPVRQRFQSAAGVTTLRFDVVVAIRRTSVYDSVLLPSIRYSDGCLRILIFILSPPSPSASSSNVA